MHLLAAAASPFVRKCRVLLIETGQDDVEVVDVHTTPMASSEQVTAANPVGKIPVLVRDGERPLFDSRVICRFLDDRARAGLYPSDGLWDVLMLEALAHAVSEAGVGMIYEMRFRAEKGLVWDEWLEKQWGKVEGALDAVEAEMMPLLEGPVTMGQVALGCALGYLDFRHGDRDWRAGRTALAAWEADFGARPSMQQTRPA